MKLRQLLFLTILLITSFGYAQLSDLHYLPPLKQGRNNQAIQQQSVYLSTPETTPFTVFVYRGTSTTSIANFTISNASPQEYVLGNGDNNITLVTNANTGVVLNNAGLRFEAPSGNSFYVNYRGVSGSQAASLTAKGRAAMGQNFKWGGAPNLGTHSSKSNTLGIMATEDNTTITLSGYNPDCTFRLGSDSDGITDNSYQIILDKNESFVFEAYLGNTFSLAQSEGWIGASVDADKDIVISNGMLNYGRQANATNRDAGMDQPVPEDRLGKEYVFVRAGGTDANEFPIIIATQNNTQIFVNGALTPMATINSGEFFMVPGSNYSSSTPGANMYVRVSKDAYAYQNIAGSTGIQTAGLNFVAPLNCLIPDTVNNIPDITDAANTTLTGGITIIASTTTPDSNIVVTDGTGIVTMPASNSVAGNSDWKTFYIPNLSGNVDVQSTGPIAVGFFGVNSNRGIAGYFSGFDVAPNVNLEITGTQCLPGAFLEIIGETFDAYQWYGDGELIVGATSTTYAPTVAGDYFVRVTKGPCFYDSNTLAAYYCDPDIELIKTADSSSLNEGDTVTFTITVQNYAVDPATNLVITDALPLGLSLVSVTPSAGTWTSPNWNVGTLNSGELETLVITALADEIDNVPYRNLTNIAFNEQDQSDSNFTTDSPFVNIEINYDNDDDNVIDSSDLDDDNDGILDSVECNVVTTNFALTGSATLSSTYPSGNASKAIDGNTNGAWSNGSIAHSQAPTNTEWLTIDLGTSELIDEVRIWNRTDCCSQRLSDAYVMISDNPFPANTNVNESLNNAEFIFQIGNTSGVSEIVIPAGIKARYVRLQQSGQNSGSLYINISELQVIGPLTCDTDSDNIPDVYDLDSDGDTCNDTIEAYYDSNADGGDGGQYGTGNPPAINLNGTVSAASYTTPIDIDTNSTFEFQEAGTSPLITIQPADEKVFLPDNGSFGLTESNTDNYQWQVSTDGGTNFNDISDGLEYVGTQTDALTVLAPEQSKNGYLYRVILTNNTFICGETISNEVELNVGPKNIITNRRITLRVNQD
ncbi:discoidin domain-containing protein [Croceitalea sp. P059]|uniref:discoidin domain-containing protein n=1 Tax=Croceitalea sp. P059 TaxID=3075601 RepID=UPI002885E6C6|nr:discoidin domain-containing protein [Croceitalea sp. P059]MDT0540306.1 discoidin domain-containing protein [Croceitalea sp. P059]